MSEINWQGLEEQMRQLQIGEKVSEDIDVRYADLMKNFMQEKPEEWSEGVRPLVKEILETYKEDPEEAAEELVAFMMKMTHQVAHHDVLLEYVVALQAKVIESLGIESRKTSKILEELFKKGILSRDNMKD
jgi:hypothetical protein